VYDALDINFLPFIRFLCGFCIFLNIFLYISIFLYIFLYISVYFCIYFCTFLYISVYISVFISVYFCIFLYFSIYFSIFLNRFLYISVYLCAFYSLSLRFMCDALYVYFSLLVAFFRIFSPISHRLIAFCALFAFICSIFRCGRSTLAMSQRRPPRWQPSQAPPWPRCYGPLGGGGWGGAPPCSQCATSWRPSFR
jgi:hypothetical protein